MIWDIFILDPIIRAIETTSILGDFVTANATLMDNLAQELDRHKVEVSSLEQQIKQLKISHLEVCQSNINVLTKYHEV